MTPLVLGVGNDWRGDDALGLIAARRLRARLDGRADVLESRALRSTGAQRL